MRAIVIEPGQSPEIRDIGSDLASLQSLVGGYIEYVSLENDIGFLVNEEGRLLGLPPNGAVYCGDALVGTVVIIKTGGEEFCSLTEAEAEEYRGRF